MIPIQKLKEAMEKASKGPWRSMRGEIGHSADFKMVVCAANGAGVVDPADTTFIVLARNHLPEILDRMEKLESVARDAKVLAHAIAVTSSEGVDVKARAEIVLEAIAALSEGRRELIL